MPTTRELHHRTAAVRDDTWLPVTTLLYPPSGHCAKPTSSSFEPESLVFAKGDVNASDYDKRCAVHLAASEGNLQIVETLLSAGANVNARDRWGGTPLRDAVREGHVKVAKFLHENGGELGLNESELSGEVNPWPEAVR